MLLLILKPWADAQSRNLLVIVDMEPDDRIALILLAAEFSDEIIFVGTTGMHAGRKAALARKFLDQMGLGTVPVIQGSGGEAESYPEIASSRAAREYQFEGRGLLPETELVAINQDMPKSSMKLSHEIQVLLRVNGNIEIVLLAPATDLVLALEQEPSLQEHIRHIHLMGGWSESRQSSRDIVRRTTYNWNMDPEAAAKLMSFNTIPMTLYSSHMIKSSFSGGSINKQGYPKIISEIESQRGQVPVFNSFLLAAKSWDHHLIEKIPSLSTTMGNHAGRQFTPADPVVVVGIARADLITKSRPVDITIDLKNLDRSRGFNVIVEDNDSSHMSLVEEVDTELFRHQVFYDLQKLAAIPK